MASQKRISLPVICARTVIWKWGDMNWPRAVNLSSGGDFYLCQPTCVSHDGTWHLPWSSTEHKERQSEDAIGETISHHLKITLWCLLTNLIHLPYVNFWKRWQIFMKENPPSTPWLHFTKIKCSPLLFLKLTVFLLECTVCAKSLWPLHVLYVWNFFSGLNVWVKKKSTVQELMEKCLL